MAYSGFLDSLRYLGGKATEGTEMRIRSNIDLDKSAEDFHAKTKSSYRKVQA